MYLKRFIRICLFFLICTSCFRKSDTIDTIIDKYARTDFSSLRGKTIHLRSRDVSNGNYIYFLSGDHQLECGPYIVTYDQSEDVIVSISNKLVIMYGGKDYLDQKEIIKAMRLFLPHKLHYLSVDNKGNVSIYINTCGSWMLLRMNPESLKLDQNDYMHYKGNWYVKEYHL